MADSTISDEGEREYVSAKRNSFYEALMDYWGEPSPVQKVLGIGVLLVIVAALVVPLMQPVRQHLGVYFYVHIAFVVVVVYLFFFKYLPPPQHATNRMRHRFIKRLQDERLQKAGLNPSVVLGTALADDPDTLEITVSHEWLDQPYERRLRDAQHLWWLWALVYSPYEGWDKALIRLVDDKCTEVGGSKPGAGSFLWLRHS